MTPREKRALVVGTAVVALAAAGRLAAVVLGEMRERVDGLEQAQALLARAADLAARAPGLGDTLAVRNVRLVSLAPLLLEGRTVPEAVANLSALMNGWAAVAGVEVRQIVPSEGVRRDPFTQVSLLFRARADLEGLARLLEALEQGPQLLSVERFTADVEPGAERSQTLAVELVVRGWVLAGEGA